MELFAGIYSRDGGDITAYQKQIGKSNIGKWHNGQAASFFLNHDHLLKEDKKNGNVAVGEIKLYNKENLVGMLPELGEDISGLSIVLAAYGKWGKECVKYFVGDFSFVVWDKKNNNVFCGRDQLGQLAFYYKVTDKAFIFANNIELVSGIDNELDDIWITDFLAANNSYKERTVFKNIRRLKPAHTLTITNANVVDEFYWDITTSGRHQVSSLQDAIDGLKWHISNAVKWRVNEFETTAIELSGGIDSGIVAALAQKKLLSANKAVTAITNVFGDDRENDSRDEWSQANKIAKTLKIEKHIAVSETGMDILDLLQTIINVVGHPIQTIGIIGRVGVLNAARNNGQNVLLSGYGGNELITEFANSRYLYDLMKSKGMFQLYRYFRSLDNSLARSLGKSVYQYWAFLIQAEKKSNQKRVVESYNDSLLKKELINNIVLPDSIPEMGIYPFHQTLREKSVSRIYSGITSDRLASYNVFARSYGVYYKYPLFHTPLMEFYYHLPDQWKASNKNGRALIRLAMKDELPADIIQGSKFIATSNAPYLIAERKKHFDQLKDWCRALPAQHRVFDYVDRAKLLNLIEKENDSVIGYRNLIYTTLLAMFMDKNKL